VSGTSAISVAEQYNYDAYGVGLSAPNNPLTSYLYAGEQFDSVLKQYYLRARYYNPVNGRFNQLDTFEGNNSDPQSLHKYDYCRGDPVNGVDPSGRFTVIEILLTVAVIAFLASVLIAWKRPQGAANAFYTDIKGDLRAIKAGGEGQKKLKAMKTAFLDTNETSKTYAKSDLDLFFDVYINYYPFACNSKCDTANDRLYDIFSGYGYYGTPAPDQIVFVKGVLNYHLDPPHPVNMLILVPYKFASASYYSTLLNVSWYDSEEKRKIIFFYGGAGPTIPAYYLYDALSDPSSPFGHVTTSLTE
jgi:RHS repeat-associated protein